MTNIVGTPVTGQEITAAQPSEFVKEIIAIIGSGVVVVLLALSAGGHVTPLVIVNAILAAITIVPVAWTSQKWWGKAIAAGIVAALQLLVTLLSPTLGWGHVTDVNWASVILAFVTAAGVGVIPNQQHVATLQTALVAEPAQAPPGGSGASDVPNTGQVASS